MAKAHDEVQAAEERAQAAEMAKIQLSMQLAELDDRQASRQELLSQDSTGEPFLQAGASHRAGTAEQETLELRQKLSTAEAALSQLEFQVRSSFRLVRRLLLQLSKQDHHM